MAHALPSCDIRTSLNNDDGNATRDKWSPRQRSLQDAMRRTSQYRT
jgi:hypothetical protein